MMIHSTLAVGSRGWLKNGNPPGDYLAAPRCGAKTRAAGCACRQPMRNGRCRFHGGKGTGARTAAGRARCASARRTHGFYSAETVAIRRQARAAIRRSRDLLAALPGRPAGHGVLPPDSRKQMSGIRSRNAATPLMPDPCYLASDSAGHGVLPPDSRKQMSGIRSRTAATPLMPDPCHLASDAAGQGVLPSILRFVRTAARWLGLQPRPRA